MQCRQAQLVRACGAFSFPDRLHHQLQQRRGDPVTAAPVGSRRSALPRVTVAVEGPNLIEHSSDKLILDLDVLRNLRLAVVDIEWLPDRLLRRRTVEILDMEVV